MSCSLIDDCIIAAASEAIGALLVDRCTIERPGLASDNHGGQTVTYSALATAVPCLIVSSRLASRESMQTAKLAGMTYWNISLPPGQDVKATDRLTVTTLSNRVFEVIGMVSASIEIVREVDAVEVL